MPFDFDKLAESPMFGAGMAMLGGSSQPGGGNGMLDAFNAMQSMRRTKQIEQRTQQEAQQAQWQNAHQEKQLQLQESQARQADERAKLYARQVQTAEAEQVRKAEAANQLRTFMQQITPSLMKSVGFKDAAGPSAQMFQQGMMAPVSPGFDHADKFVAAAEGVGPTTDTGGLTKYGISSKAHPDIDVGNLDAGAAQKIRRTYWDAIKGDSLDPATAMVAYDAAVLQGKDYAPKLIERTGGNPALMLQQRRTDLKELAKQPLYKPFEQGWMNRLDKLGEQLKAGPGLAGGQTPPQQEQGIQPSKAMQIFGHLMQGMVDPDKAGESLAKAGEAMEPKYHAPGSVGTDGTILPNPEFDHRKKQDVLKQENEVADRAIKQQTADAATGRARADLQAQERQAEKQRVELKKIGVDDQKAFSTINANTDLLNRKADELSAHPGLERIFGLQGKIPDYPGSDAANARTLQKSTIAQMAKETLAQIRDASKTGGALGNVSDKDIELLQTAIVSLDSAQSPGAAKNALKEVKGHMNRIRDIQAKAFEDTHGKSPFGEGAPVGSRPTGEQRNGKAVFVGPDGRKFIIN